MSSVLMTFRFKLFQAIEWAASCIQRNAVLPLQHHIPEDFEKTDSGSQYLWVFASTIGELHAIQPFLIQMLKKRGSDRIVILTDHPHYIEAFLKVFPQAVVIDHGVDGRVEREIDTYSPDLFILAEIPCTLYDAPCRFSYRVIYRMKLRGIPVVAVNCWLYSGEPGCRIDAIEKYLLNRDYFGSIDLFTAQTDEVREQLIQLGVEPAKVEVTGNIKFDALNLNEDKWVLPSDLKPLIDELHASKRPVIVAGCVTNISEQDFVLDAFELVLKESPESLLVLAPRHPENKGRMAQLSEMLLQRGISFSLRSEYGEEGILTDSVLILDTIGELKYMYAAASVCYVGLNHNVLEPLAVNKPVIVTHGWEKAYPSYPVYRQTNEENLITEVITIKDFAECTLDKMKPYGNGGPDETNQAVKLQSLMGASSRTIDLLYPYMKNKYVI